MVKKLTAVVVAAGASSRMESAGSKLLLPLEGKTVLRRSLEALDRCGAIDEIVLVFRETDKMKMLNEAKGIRKLAAAVAGGENRQASVMNGVRAATGQYVAIHDGARPLVTQEEIHSVCADGIRYGAATLSCVPKDTIKFADAMGFVGGTPSREGLRLIATPQVFDREEYMRSAAKAEKEGKVFTDDCQLIENNGGRVYLTRGKYTNIKITTPEDIAIAESIIRRGRDEEG